MAALRTTLPVVLALCAALSNALATVLQRKAALAVPRSAGLRAGLMLDLLRRPVWLAGMLAVIAAAVCQAAALATGASVLLHRRLPGRGWLAVGTVVAGLAVALAAASPTGNRTDVPPDRWIPALAVCSGTVVVLALAALRRPEGRARAACLGAATAIGYAMTAALMKSATHALDERGLLGFLSAWQTYAFAATGVCALFLLENAMQAGPLAASQPALTLGDAAVSLVLGITLYEEAVRAGWWLLPQLCGVALIVAGVVSLARTPLARTLVAQDRQEQRGVVPAGRQEPPPVSGGDQT